MVFAGNGIVWNPETNSALCRFSDGKFETEDKAHQKRLIDMGYKVLKEDYIDVEFKEEEMTYLEMKAYCKKNGLTGYNKMNKEELKEFISQMEG